MKNLRYSLLVLTALITQPALGSCAGGVCPARQPVKATRAQTTTTTATGSKSTKPTKKVSKNEQSLLDKKNAYNNAIAKARAMENVFYAPEANRAMLSAINNLFALKNLSTKEYDKVKKDFSNLIPTTSVYRIGFDTNKSLDQQLKDMQTYYSKKVAIQKKAAEVDNLETKNVDATREQKSLKALREDFQKKFADIENARKTVIDNMSQGQSDEDIDLIGVSEMYERAGSWKSAKPYTKGLEEFSSLAESVEETPEEESFGLSEMYEE